MAKKPSKPSTTIRGTSPLGKGGTGTTGVLGSATPTGAGGGKTTSGGKSGGNK